MKIVRMTAENVKRIEAIEITPDGNMIVVGGKNGAGKSSVLDAIQYALAGKAATCSEPIRRGEDSANIVCAIGDDPEKPEIIVRRRFTEKGSSLSVENADGAKFPSPQAMLDKLTGALTFDPLEFSRMDQKTRREALLKILGLDFEKVDAQIHGLYDKRADANREVKRLDVLLKNMGQPAPNVPDKAPDTAVILERIRDASRIEQARTNADGEAAAARELRDDAQRTFDMMNRNHVAAAKDAKEADDAEQKCALYAPGVGSCEAVEDIRARQAELSRSLETALERERQWEDAKRTTDQLTAERDRTAEILKTDRKQVEGRITAANDAEKKKTEAEAAAEAVSVSALEEELADANGVAEAVRRKEVYAATSRGLVRARTQSADCSNRMDDLLDQKMKAVADANLPVDGLALSETGDITLAGLPFDQASGADQLRVSVAMAITANPELRIMLIRDGSLLDEESLAMIATMAEEADAQVWIERVGNDEHVTVLIEDGFVAAPSDLDNEGAE